jgi:HSP20 family protein
VLTGSSTVPVKKTNGKLQPYGFFDELEDEMQRFFGWPVALSPTYFPAVPRISTRAKAWTPRMDIFEKDGTIVLKAELPGLKKEDVQVEMMGEDLIISGEAKAETEVKEDAYYRTERTFGSFYRRMPLPAGTKADQIQATLTDGVLEVQIPKPAAVRPEPTKVEVK